MYSFYTPHCYALNCRRWGRESLWKDINNTSLSLTRWLFHIPACGFMLYLLGTATMKAICDFCGMRRLLADVSYSMPDQQSSR